MWYVVQVTAGREDEAAAELGRQGIRALVPKENRLVRRGGRWTRSVYVLFGGYVFLDMAYNAENYYKVKRAPGVVRFLGEAGNPSRLSWPEAEWIRLLTGRDNAPIEPTLVRADAEGRVTAVRGVLEKVDGRLVSWDRRGRKATFKTTICGEEKEVRLSILLEEDLQQTQDGEDPEAADDAAGGGTEEESTEVGTLQEAD